MATCSSCSCNPCCCPEPHPVPAPPVVSVESHPAALPDCPSCPPVIHEVLESFTIPAVDGSAFVSVCDANAWPVGMCVHITDGNRQAVLKIVSVNTLTETIELQNQGSSETDDAGIVMSGQINMVLHGICPTELEEQCFLLGVRTAAPFALPEIGVEVVIQLDSCVKLSQGQQLYIEGFGCVQVVSQNADDFMSFEATVDDLYDSQAGDIISGGAYVTTAEVCIPASGGDFLGGGEETGTWAAVGEGPDPTLSVTVPVLTGQKVRIEGCATLESPRNGLRFSVTGTASPSRLVGLTHWYEDGFDHGPGVGDGGFIAGGNIVDAIQYMTASQSEVWEAQADGDLTAKWEVRNGPTGTVAVNIKARTIIITSA